MKIIGENEITVDASFAKEIQKHCGENVNLCYQCRKCAAGCPNRQFMDFTPTELMRYVQLGMFDEALKKNTAWFCVSCQTCTARCPQDIDIARVIDAIRMIADERRLVADAGNVRVLNRLWMIMLRFMGRMYEVGLVGTFNMVTGKPFNDMALGKKMILKGKLKFIPSIKMPFTMMKMFSRAKKIKERKKANS
ncbi:MAG: heterodisulfide reductase subunit C [Planctomycetes bacterium]|nr:heterodisulfide reductase subunit C [Planctomycetota bacterium]